MIWLEVWNKILYIVLTEIIGSVVAVRVYMSVIDKLLQ